MNLWGIDLGGTKIEGAILDPENVTTAVHRLRVPTESAKGYDHILNQIESVITQLEQVSGHERPARLGIGTPGAIEPSTGILKNSNTLCLNDRPLRDDIAEKLGIDIHLANDANCFALAEATLGAAKGEKIVMGLILGTGVGGGVVIDGHVLDGAHGIAGEWGHNTMRGETTPCYCGKSGCVEKVFAGPSLERFYNEQTGQAIRLPEIVKRAAAGEAPAVATLERLREKFAEAIAVPINIIDPHAIVIGGGVGNLDLLYSDETRQAVLKYVFNKELHTKFLKPTLGDSAGVFGAAMLARA